MSTYVMSDIHGHALEFIEMLEKINFSDKDKLYLLGDVIDKGPDGVAVLRIVNKANNIELIKGNHEAMMLDYLQGKDNGNWFENCGEWTWDDYQLLNKKEKAQIYNLLYDLPLYKLIAINGRQFFLSHAGMAINSKFSLEKLIELNEQQEECFYWTRRGAFFLDVDVRHLNTTFIFGHTAVHTLSEFTQIDEENQERIKKNQIYKTDYKIDIDVGAAYGMSLACLRLDDMEEFYVDCHS